MSNVIDPLRTPEDAAAFLGLSEHTLAVWRSTGRYDLPFVRVGRRVRYRQSALEEFVSRRTVGDGAAA